jgi:hypothetical protein
MADRDRLSSLVLQHWSRCCPRMLHELKQQNRLEETLLETMERFTDLLYDLLSVRKMEYTEAWDMAIREILPPEESHST